jgi:hypothetical protein
MAGLGGGYSRTTDSLPGLGGYAEEHVCGPRLSRQQ